MLTRCSATQYFRASSNFLHLDSKWFFLIRVQKFILSIHVVLEICGLKVAVSFNFALSAPHDKRCVKSCVPRAAAATGVPARILALVNLVNQWLKYWLCTKPLLELMLLVDRRAYLYMTITLCYDPRCKIDLFLSFEWMPACVNGNKYWNWCRCIQRRDFAGLF